DEEVHETVVVVIAGGHRETVDTFVQPRFDGDVGERAIAVVAVEAASAVGRRDDDVEQPVVVVIENGGAASRTGLVEPDLFGDIFELHAGRRVSGLNLHLIFD